MESESNAFGRLARHVRRTARQLRRRGGAWTLLLVATGWFLTLGLRFLVPALLPQIKAAFRIDNAAAGVAVTIIWLTYALMQFPAGALVDRIGERRLLAASLALGGLSVAALSLAPVFGGFLLACAMFGLATGLYGPPRGTVLSNTYSENDGAAFGFTLAAGSVGSAALPLLASLFVPRLGWRFTMAVWAPLFLLTAALMWRNLPNRPVDPAVGEFSIDETVAAVRAGLRQRSVAVAVAAMTLVLFTFQGLTAFLPTYLISVKGLSQAAATALFALLFLSGAAFQLVAGGAADRYGEKRVLTVIAGVGVVTLLLLPVTDGLLPLAALVVVLGSRMAIGPVTNAYVIRDLPSAVQGTSWGLLRTGFFVLASSASIFVGVFGDLGWFDAAFLALAGITAVATALYAFLLPRGRSTGGT